VGFASRDTTNRLVVHVDILVNEIRLYGLDHFDRDDQSNRHDVLEEHQGGTISLSRMPLPSRGCSRKVDDRLGHHTGRPVVPKLEEVGRCRIPVNVNAVRDATDQAHDCQQDEIGQNVVVCFALDARPL
jgi:hypothetical protein